MKNLILLFTIFAFLADFSVSAQQRTPRNSAAANRLIGYKFKPEDLKSTLPNGFTPDVGGGLITETAPMFAGFHLVKDGTHSLWLVKATEENEEEGVMEWEIRQTTEFAGVGKNQEILFSAGDVCQKNGKNISNFIALVDFLPEHKKYKVAQIWEINISTETIKAIPIAGVQCLYQER